jgi:hypothetical protein
MIHSKSIGIFCSILFILCKCVHTIAFLVYLLSVYTRLCTLHVFENVFAICKLVVVYNLLHICGIPFLVHNVVYHLLYIIICIYTYLECLYCKNMYKKNTAVKTKIKYFVSIRASCCYGVIYISTTTKVY